MQTVPSSFALQLDHAATSEASNNALPIIVHCHLRWDFVWQRPQQIFVRLAARHRIAFIEEPLTDDGETRLAVSEPFPNVVRIVPTLYRAEGLPVDAQWAALLPHLQRAFNDHPLLAGRFGRAIHWFYSPMVAPAMLGKFDTAAVVYDCMDELAGFADVSAEWLSRERELLARSDLVFTGGQSSHQARRWPHARVHEFPNGGDADARARGTSWDETCEAMDALLDQVLTDKAALRPRPGRRTRQVAAARELQ